MNISVPADLKKEMDRIKEDVNWSAVAAEAFREHLLRLSASRKGTKMEDVIARLKAATELEENEDFQAGHEIGERWAKSAAKPKQLGRLSDAFNSHEGLFVGSPLAPYGWSDLVYNAIHGQMHDPSERSCFWENMTNENGALADDEDWLRGFCAGASEVWDQVADRL
jgi:hypothetical protein